MCLLLLFSWLTLSAAQRAPEDAAARELLHSLPLVLEGTVRTESGAPAASAIVRCDAGGRSVTDAQGRFRLELELPADVLEVEVTAVQTSASFSGSAHLRVAVPAGGTLPIGTLLLAPLAGCTPTWLPNFGEMQELHGAAYALASFDSGNGPELYAGGLDFNAPVARWDGTSWSAVGSLTGGGVWALRVFDDGSGPALYAAGEFTSADGQPASGLAKWDGSVWSGIDLFSFGVDDYIHSLEVFDDGSGPALYAAGSFTAVLGGVPVQRVMRWNGTAWTGVGSGPSGDGIGALVAVGAGPGGGPKLHAIQGVFGPPMQNRIVSWDGTSWTEPVGGFSNTQPVYATVAFDDGSGPALYVGGLFTQAGGTSAHNIARWDGTSWSAVGAGPSFEVRALTVFEIGGTPTLIAGGKGKLSVWDGSTWSTPMKMLTDGVVSTFLSFDDGTGPELFIGSDQATNSAPSCYVSKWNGTRVTTLGSWLNAEVDCVRFFDDGLGGGPALHAGGKFTIAGGGSAQRVARWDGSSWSALGAGIEGGTGAQAGVNALLDFDDGSGPGLFAGGFFDTAGGASANNIARWNGSAWARLRAGTNERIYCLAVFDDGLGGGPRLIAGGAFSSAGGVACASIAAWDGTVWAPLGSGTNGAVLSLAVHDSGSGPELYAGGSFSAAGGVAALRLARWNGSSWAAFGNANNQVLALCSFDDGLGGGPALYAAGFFTTISGVSARAIARWDGGWSALGTGLTAGSGNALLVHDDGNGPALYVGGTFTGVDGVPAARVARWDGSSWSALDNGVANGSVYALTGNSDAGLFVGGNFSGDGPPPDSFLRRWACDVEPPVLHCPPSVFAGTFGTTGRVVSFEVTAEDAGDPAPLVQCTPPSGSFFPLGTTLVDCTATDFLGNQSTCQFPVTVERRTRMR